MKKFIKKSSTILLISLLAISMLVGCGSQHSETGVSENESTPTSAIAEESEESVEPTSTPEATVEPSEEPTSTPEVSEEPTSTPNPTEAPEATEEPESTPEPTEAPETPAPTEEPTEPPHTHNYSASVTQPTCTTQGYTTYTCSCGDSYRDDYTTGSHNYSNGTCTVCGTADPNYVPPHTHSWTDKTWTEDKVTQTEVEVFVCNCNIEWSTIDALVAHQDATPQCGGWRNKYNIVETITQIIHHYRECACGAREDID